MNLKSSFLASVKDVAPVRLCLKEWIVEVYQARHGLPEDQKREWPFAEGGTFQEVVQRAWGDMDTLIQDSLRFLKLVGMVEETADAVHMKEKFMKMKDGKGHGYTVRTVWRVQANETAGYGASSHSNTDTTTTATGQPPNSSSGGISAFHGRILFLNHLAVELWGLIILEGAKYGERARHCKVHRA